MRRAGAQRSSWGSWRQGDWGSTMPGLQRAPPPQTFLRFLFLPVQAPLQHAHVGPEELVQAFVNKDPLASTRVEGPQTRCPCSDPPSPGRGRGADPPNTSRASFLATRARRPKQGAFRWTRGSLQRPLRGVQAGARCPGKLRRRWSGLWAKCAGRGPHTDFRAALPLQSPASRGPTGSNESERETVCLLPST